jgi:hypothetical protein
MLRRNTIVFTAALLAVFTLALPLAAAEKTVRFNIPGCAS